MPRHDIPQALLGRFWDTVVAGRSVPLLALSAVIGVLTAVTNAVVWEWSAGFVPLFTSAMSTGMGVSNALPSVVGLIQDPGPGSRFSIGLYFGIGAGLCGLGAVMVAMIHFLRMFNVTRRHRRAVGVEMISPVANLAAEVSRRDSGWGLHTLNLNHVICSV